MHYSPIQSITLNGWQVKYRVLGEGPDVLLVHGWASSGRMWQRLMNDLSERYRCWALDLPGFGDSDKPHDTWYSISAYVELVTRFVNTLALRQPALVGHSMGGMITLALAAENYSSLSRLIAINPVVTGRTYLDLRMLANPRLSQSMSRIGHLVWPITASDWAGPWFGGDRPAHYQRMREEWRQSTPISLMATARAIGQCDLTPVLPLIATPTMILVGNRDFTAPNAEGKHAARHIPGARLEIVSSGHLPTDDLPDKTFGLVDSFLTDERIRHGRRSN
jgi:3-oxoadipate enol-lactonase